MNSRDLVYEAEGVGRSFAGPGGEVEVLSRVDLRVERGQSLAVMGASGSGKTTLLHLLGTLDTPSRGTIRFEGSDLGGLSAPQKAKLRNERIGFVFQLHHLLPEFSTLENVAMPALIGGVGRARALEMSAEALSHVGLTERSGHMVTTLSGGERQRAAIARAILMKPSVLLADEPTGSLDEATGSRVGDLLMRLNRELAMTLVVVTHNLELAAKMERQLELTSGELNARIPRP